MTSAARRRLRPGLVALRRSPTALQVGLDADAPVFADEAEVAATLRALAGPGLAAAELAGLGAGARAAVARLDDAGLVVDDAERERRRRDRALLALTLEASAPVRALAEPLIAAAGLGVGEAGAADAQVHLVVVDGVLDREDVDPLVREGRAHLVLAGSADGLRLGPLVVPGLTACVRCVDAHEAQADARRPLLLAQAAAAHRERHPPRDPLLDHLALAWAVRDLALLAEGERPSTWSATVQISAVGAPCTTAWGRHPECGCCWDALPPAHA